MTVTAGPGNISDEGVRQRVLGVPASGLVFRGSYWKHGFLPVAEFVSAPERVDGALARGQAYSGVPSCVAPGSPNAGTSLDSTTVPVRPSYIMQKPLRKSLPRIAACNWSPSEMSTTMNRPVFVQPRLGTLTRAKQTLCSSRPCTPRYFHAVDDRERESHCQPPNRCNSGSLRCLRAPDTRYRRLARRTLFSR